MHYSYEFKLMCVEMYRKGQYPETPDGINQYSFQDQIRSWARIEKACGPEALKHKNQNKVWTPEEKFELVAQIIVGKSIKEVSCAAGINSGQLYSWVQKYKTHGYNGLIDKKKGRKSSKEQTMKKKVEPKPLTESEREELVRLRAEIAYIKAENEIIKKEIALREEKEGARLKAKKQLSSKNSVKKDMH